MKKPSQTQPSAFKDHILAVIEMVHGSKLNKAKLADEVLNKLPQLQRKSEVKQFLSTYCNRSKERPAASDSKRRSTSKTKHR